MLKSLFIFSDFLPNQKIKKAIALISNSIMVLSGKIACLRVRLRHKFDKKDRKTKMKPIVR